MATSLRHVCARVFFWTIAWAISFLDGISCSVSCGRGGRPPGAQPIYDKPASKTMRLRTVCFLSIGIITAIPVHVRHTASISDMFPQLLAFSFPSPHLGHFIVVGNLFFRRHDVEDSNFWIVMTTECLKSKSGVG